MFKMILKCYASYKYRGWVFTGRIKYLTFVDRETIIEFEISYPDNYSRIPRYQKLRYASVWMRAENFVWAEFPVETIIECGG